MTSDKPVEPRETSQPRASGERLMSRIGAGLASPLGILMIMPGLVGVVGAFLSFLGEYSLTHSNLEVAQGRMVEQARLAASSVREALEQSDPILDRLEDLVLQHAPEQPFAPVAHAMLDLMKGRAGVTYVSVSFPDGTFQGAYLDGDGVTRFQDSRVSSDGTHVDRYTFATRGELILQRQDRSAYDPRVRGFYLLATSEQKRVWTAPYLFYDSHTAGITRASPVYRTRPDGTRGLHAVVTIDFDVNGLSSYLSSRQINGMRALLYARDGTILAYASDRQDALPLYAPSDQPLRFQDLSDPVLKGFFAEVQRSRSGPHTLRGPLTVRVGQESYLSAIAAVTPDPALPWSLAYVMPERHILRELYSYEDRSIMVGGSAVMLSTLLAFLFARHITRVREEAAEAKAEARQARQQAREAREEARELGSYRLVACLGRGGMGEVWRAQHRLLAREAAIKLIKTEEASDVSDSMRERFRREAEALARLRSRNTIELFDYGVADDGTFFLVMELLDGVDFDTLVAKHGPQPASRVVHLMIQVCNSLAEAHAQGLVHRDIKPANLFVCRAADEVDVVKVLDFGLVRAALDREDELVVQEHTYTPWSKDLSTRLTNAEGMVGTPAYMAPEQVTGRALDGRADLYALGGVAYWLLTGKLVFNFENGVEQLLAHVHSPVPDLRAVLPGDVPDDLIALIASCLAKSPDDRPCDARALGRALKAIQFDDERAWTEARAHDWWQQKKPQPSRPPPALVPRELQIAAATVSITKR
jgi:serine/threonine protein kinase